MSLHTRRDIAQAVVDNVVEGIVVIDDHGIVQYFNPAAELMFGLTSAEILGRNVSELMPSPHREKHDEYLASYFRTGEARIIGFGREVEGRRRDGELFPMDLSVARTTLDGKTYFVGVIRDISERKESEAMLAMNARVSRAINKALGQFISASLWSKKELFDDILESLLNLTDSEYGFIGEVHTSPEGVPYLKTHAITNIAWNQETRKLYKENARQGLEFYNLNTLFGVTVRTGEVVIANDPMNDPRRGGLPPGHPGLHTYMGLPIYAGNKFIGMAGIANRPGGYDEELADLLKPLIGTIGSIIAGFQNLQTRRKAESDLYRAQQKLRQLATQDALTELPNRHALMVSIEDAFKRSRDLGIPFSVVFIDVDHFKQVNDTHGHRVGDEVLRQVAKVLQVTLRPTDLLGRYGGEEFVGAFVDSDLAGAEVAAERLRNRIEGNSFRLEGAPAELAVTISVGVATSHPAMARVESAQELINQADQAVYEAKQAGRNRVCVYRAPEMDEPPAEGS